jgi:hypothetical protein
MKYIVLECAAAQQLTGLVLQFISEGWKPQGGMSVATDQGNWSYCQAMIKE